MKRIVSLLLTIPLLAAAEEQKPLYLAIETPPAPVLSAEDALAAFRVAPGFVIEAVASEPLVEDPVAIAWDEAGRAYVAEMRSYMPDSYGNGQLEPIGAVARLIDTDGDGRFDQREDMLDGLVLPRAVAVVQEGLLIAEPPNLWLCPSDTGSSDDIDCAKKRSLGTYGDQPGSVEHAENGLLLALDNWMYSAKSERRLRIRNGALEAEPTLFRGQWGIAQDNAGRLYYNTNSNLLSGDYYNAQALVQAGARAAPGLNELISKQDVMFAVRVNTGVNRAYVPGVLREDGRLNRPTSASGMVAYRGHQFGSEHSSDFYVAEPAANAVSRLVGREDGLVVSAAQAYYPDDEWQQREFVASTDERFRPVSLSIGPDGALYIVDFYRGIIQDHVFISEQLRAQVEARGLERPLGQGRIWRVRKADVQPDTLPTDLRDADTTALLDALGAPNGWQRDTAQRLLIASDDRKLNRTLSRSLSDRNSHKAVHALWTLSGREALTAKTTRTAARQGNVELARQALLAGAHLLSNADLLKLKGQHSADARFQHNRVLALAGRADDEAIREHLSELLADGWQDPYRVAAVRAAARGAEAQLVASLSRTWNQAQEKTTNFLRDLSEQTLTTAPETTPILLNLAANEDVPAWQRKAVLGGTHRATRKAGFERIVLKQSHGIFDAENSTHPLWPDIAAARRAFTWEGDDLAAGLPPLTAEESARHEAGADFYQARCATCHGSGGEGIAGLAPPLKGSEWITTATERLVRVMLQGLQGPIEVNGQPWNGVMPGHGHELDDDTGAGLVTFLHRAWGGNGRVVAPAFVAHIRAETQGRALPWTAEELSQIDINTHFKRYTGRYGGGPFEIRFSYDGQQLQIGSGIFNGPVTRTAEHRFLFAPRGMDFEFQLAPSGAVVGVLIHGDGGGLLPRIGDG